MAGLAGYLAKGLPVEVAAAERWYGKLERLRRKAVITSEMLRLRCGEMAEWLKAHAWKACIPQGIQGSNPCLSAKHSSSDIQHNP